MVINSIEPVRTRVFPSIPFFSHDFRGGLHTSESAFAPCLYVYLNLVFVHPHFPFPKCSAPSTPSVMETHIFSFVSLLFGRTRRLVSFQLRFLNRLLRTCGLLARHLFILGHVSSYSACLPELQQFAPACRDRLLIYRERCAVALSGGRLRAGLGF